MQESATALAEMASSVHPDACEEHCVQGILKLTKDRVWAVRVAAAAALPGVARGRAPLVLLLSTHVQQLAPSLTTGRSHIQIDELGRVTQPPPPHDQ